MTSLKKTAPGVHHIVLKHPIFTLNLILIINHPKSIIPAVCNEMLAALLCNGFAWMA